MQNVDQVNENPHLKTTRMRHPTIQKHTKDERVPTDSRVLNNVDIFLVRIGQKEEAHSLRVGLFRFDQPKAIFLSFAVILVESF